MPAPAAETPPDARLWRGATVVPMDGPPDSPCGRIRVADVRVRGDRIRAVGGGLTPEAGEIVHDASGLTLLPGFVQGHVHFCQTLFRGLADDRPLLDWLRQRIFPLEAAHDAGSTRLSAELSTAELLRGGTTTVQMFESVRYTEEAARAAANAGLTATFGNCLIDIPGDGVPDGFATSAAEALRLADELRRTFHGQHRLRYAITPRFILSCSAALSRDASAYAREHGLRTHTHASEHPGEVAEVQRRCGSRYLEVLRAQGYLDGRAGLAHCVHLDDVEVELLRDSGASVLHCPTANLKLGSGIAPVARYRALGVPVALGADGAPCNGRLSALTELRQAALLQALHAGPGRWPAAQALFTATRGGALATGHDDAGCIAPGMRADLLLFDLRDPALGSHAAPDGTAPDPVAKLVWSAGERHLREVVVGGRRAVRDGRLVDVDTAALADRATHALRGVLQRAGLCR